MLLFFLFHFHVHFFSHHALPACLPIGPPLNAHYFFSFVFFSFCFGCRLAQVGPSTTQTNKQTKKIHSQEKLRSLKKTPQSGHWQVAPLGCITLFSSLSERKKWTDSDFFFFVLPLTGWLRFFFFFCLFLMGKSP